MGYSITIGAARLESEWPHPDAHDEDGCRKHVLASWHVDTLSLPEAPDFFDSGRENTRHPSYTVWADFARALGLYEWFYDQENGVLREHPGIAPLDKADVALLEERVASYKAKNPGVQGGFCLCEACSDGFPQTDQVQTDHVVLDPHLARAEWLLWWVRWAVAECVRPAIENT
jgi:hypothetical protein